MRVSKLKEWHWKSDEYPISFGMRGKWLNKEEHNTHLHTHTYRRINPNIYKANEKEKDGKCS